jgi:hypothetical protein
MENSFYYFFSATPQVLGGIMALFGVFVIFKIELIKTELIGVGHAIYDDNYKFAESKLPIDLLVDNEDNKVILDRIRKVITRKDIQSLTSIFELIDKYGNCYYETYSSAYFLYLNAYKTLLKQTVRWSIFTTILIIICLSMIPIGHLICNHIFILYLLFILVLIGIIINFYGLITILKKSLNDYR